MYFRATFSGLLFTLWSGIAPGNEPFLNAVPICYNFDCNTKQNITITTSEWKEIVALFNPAARNAEQELIQIRTAMGRLEVIAGRHTPIHLDLGRNNLERGSLGQMDCVDESINISTYIGLLERGGLLRFHKPVERAYRRTIWDQHWAGQIQDLQTGQRWVLDSWFRDYGYPPYIQRSEEWLDIPFFFPSSFINSAIEQLQQ